MRTVTPKMVLPALLLVFSSITLQSCGVPDNIHGKTGKTNTPPFITGYSPAEKSISAKDGDLLNFWIKAQDSDNDPLTYTWNLNGGDVSKVSGSLLDGTYYSFNVNISQGTSQQLIVFINDPYNNIVEWAWLINVTR